MDRKQIELSVQHIFDSGVNEIRICDLIELLLEQQSKLKHRSDKITLLESYSKFLEENGYIDSDWWGEEPFAIDEFLKEENNEPEQEEWTQAQIRSDIDCPECGEHHIDKAEWSKRLHRKHQCEKCNHIWQPYDHYTFGI